MQMCSMAKTIIGILADVNLFWEYDNRENMSTDKDGNISGDEAV